MLLHEIVSFFHQQFATLSGLKESGVGVGVGKCTVFDSDPVLALNHFRTAQSTDWHGAALLCNLDIYIYIYIYIYVYIYIYI